MADHTLIIGNRNYSSWSLRGWLMCRIGGLAVDEVLIRLNQPDTRSEIFKHSPSGQVPALVRADGFQVWDSLAIAEYVHDRTGKLWPADADARALARAVSAEMHSGFAELRRHFPMNIRHRVASRPPTAEAQANIVRISAIWRDCRKLHGAGGPFLFGAAFTAADAMYAPVVSRFQTYQVQLDPEAQAYSAAVLAQNDMAEWCAAALREPWINPDYEF